MAPLFVFGMGRVLSVTGHHVYFAGTEVVNWFVLGVPFPVHALLWTTAFKLNMDCMRFTLGCPHALCPSTAV